MKLRSRLLALLIPAVALLGQPTGAKAIFKDVGAIPDPSSADACEPFGGDERLVCLSIGTGDPENLVGPSASACIYDETWHRVFWWYGGIGKLGCAHTYHWAYLGAPGACVGTGATGDPTACIGKDERDDTDLDGEADDPIYCLVWVAGSGFCWYE